MTLLEILDTMNVPQQRKSDSRWLLRNLAILNRDHPQFATAITLLKQTQRETRFNPHYTAGFYNFPYVGKTVDDRLAYDLGRQETNSLGLI